MTQSYFPATARAASPLPEPAPSVGEKPLKAEDVQGAYIEQKDRQVAAARLVDARFLIVRSDC